MRRVVLLRHVRVGAGLEVLVQALVVLVGGAAVHARGDDFFLGGVDVGVVQGGLDEGGGLFFGESGQLVKYVCMEYL